MSEILEKLKLKLSRLQKGELILNIILGVWTIVGFICSFTNLAEMQAALMAFGITALIIIAVDGCFIFAISYCKRKISKQNQKEGILS